MHTVDYFIEKFSSIPEENWTTGEWVAGQGVHCAMGHCGAKGDGNYTEESFALNHLVKTHLGYGYSVEEINDGDNPEYKELTPKERILSALHDIKAIVNPNYKDITKQLATLPQDEIPDKVGILV